MALDSNNLTDFDRAVALWKLLDDVDCALDVFKGEDQKCLDYISDRIQLRHEILKSDGYALERF